MTGGWRACKFGQAPRAVIRNLPETRHSRATLEDKWPYLPSLKGAPIPSGPILNLAMTDIDLDDLDPLDLSLCEPCAKHWSLKRFVLKNGQTGIRCGVCLNVSATQNTCDLGQRKSLIYLIRALIRFHYGEHEFNGHWGASETPTSLLQSDNPVIESASAPGFDRSSDHSWVFFEDINDNDVYPPYDEGIALYAGHDEHGGRGLNRPLTSSDGWIGEFRRRLQTENHFAVEPDLRKLVEAVADRIAVTVPQGQEWFRARLGVQAHFSRAEGWNGKLVFQPYQDHALGSPPPAKAKAGRLNRDGVSFLYLASDPETACAEIRPHPSHHLSVGRFRSVRDLRIADLEADIADFASSDTELDFYAFVYAADGAMSLPVRPDEEGRYSITQLIADVLRQHGFDGVAFKSSIQPGGRNICLFQPSACVYVADSALVRHVKHLRYEIEEVPSVLQPDDGDWPLT